MFVHHNVNDHGQSASYADLRCAESNLSRWELISFADFIFEWNHRNLVTRFEQPSYDDLHLHSIRWTMFVHHNFEYHGQSHHCSHIRSCESNLSRWEFIRVANKFTEWNHWNVESSFE